MIKRLGKIKGVEFTCPHCGALSVALADIIQNKPDNTYFTRCEVCGSKVTLDHDTAEFTVNKIKEVCDVQGNKVK